MADPASRSRRLLRLALPLALFVTAACGSGASAEDEADDPRLLAGALSQCLLGDGETLSAVYPDTLLVLSDTSGAALNSVAERLGKLAGDPGYDARPLLDRLLKRNKRSHALSLEDKPGGNFTVDRQGACTKYLVSGNEGDWKRMFHDHPEIRSVVHVGLPAYDREKGLALVYVQEMTQAAAGNGSIYILAWDGTTAEKLGRVVVWSP